MSDPAAPPLIERIVRALARERLPRSTGDLAREYLGMGFLDEALAERLLGPTLGGDDRLERTPAGWIVREEGLAYAVPVAFGIAPVARLDQPWSAVFAPFQPPVAAVTPGDGARYAVAPGGEAEVRRAEERLGRWLPRPVVDLAAVCRRLSGYRGPADPRRMAEALRVPHVEADDPAVHAAITGALWSALALDLAREGVVDTAGLDALLEARLERAEFEGRAFDDGTIAALPSLPGVYMFRDRRRRPLYVGQSQNLAARVASYFTGPPRDEKDRALRGEAHALETRTVDTTPDAWILEARWIRRHAPRLNTRLAVRATATEDGLLALPAADTTRVVLFVLRNGGLAERISTVPGPRRLPAAVARAATALFESGAPDEIDIEAGALVDAWRRVHPDALFLRPAVNGGPDDIARAILAGLRG